MNSHSLPTWAIICVTTLMNWAGRTRWLLLLAMTIACGDLPLVYPQVPPNNKAATVRWTRPEPTGMFDLQVARLYEGQGRWKEAEQEYLQAGRIGAPCVKKEALAAIERLRIHRPPDEENLEFELGRLYEGDHAWKDAEQHYAASAKDATKPVRDKALDAVKRMQEHRLLENYVEDFDRWAGYAARVLGVAFLFVVAWRVRKTRQAIEIMPFEAPNEEAIKRVIFSLSSAREALPGVLAPLLATTGTNVVDSIPLIILPGLENEFPDPAEDLEVGEIKLPLANWIRMLKSPRIRVFGRWSVGGITGTARARILRRRRVFSYRESRDSSFSVPSAAGDPQDRQLSLFAYDVLIKAIFARLYGP